MRVFFRLDLVLILPLVFMAGIADVSAYTANFVDNSIYWSKWQNGTADDTKDTIGIPNLTGGQAVLNGNLLTSLTFYNATTSSPYWSVLSPGDLFIDIDSNDTWDYVVKLATWPAAGAVVADPGAPPYSIYSVNLALGSPLNYTGYIEKIHNPVPEPATMLLFGSGLLGLAAVGRKRYLRRR